MFTIFFYQHEKFEFLKFSLIDNFEVIMVNKCSVIRGHNTGAVFGLPKEEDLRLWRITFLHGNDVSKLKNIFICKKCVDDRFLNKNGKRTSLIINEQPFPSILSDTQKKLSLSILPTILVPQKPPTRRITHRIV